jgi:hypothetical protein
VSGPLEELLARWRRESAALDEAGAVELAEARLRMARDVEAATAEWRAALNLSEAMLYTGRTERWLRSEWVALEAQSPTLAWKVGRSLMFRRVALRRRADVARARANGERAAA